MYQLQKELKKTPKLLVEILVKTVFSFKASMYDNPHINLIS